jgi:dihydroflavonol-4-reductase
MKPILITGATGFLGKHLVELLKPRAKLRLLCRGSSPWDQYPQVEVVRGDVTDRDAVRRAMEGVGHVYHLAGVVSRNPKDAELLYRTHVEGTRHVCDAARDTGPERILVASSSGTIAVGREPVEHDEASGYKNEVVGEWPYYLSKIYQEKLALSYASSGQAPVVVVNPSLLLGPGDERGSSTGDIRLFLAGQIQAVPLGGLNFLDVRDAAAGCVAAMERGRIGERYLLGGPNWTFGRLIQTVARLSGRRAPSMQLSVPAALWGAKALRALYPLAGKRYELDDASIRMSALFWYCNSAKARNELGFTTRDPEETLRATIEDLRGRR